ncbi:MAG TPA: O-acetyl-ADP-ribose deacetylase [bacterium]|nr:O-acetyl-ADP-ribose deacetylase [Candidatus Omnitrophota bacterium]HOJ61523.1 O-acetyl-ADP-ribose deacetylase [bacterium]HOL93407.1 O-acetyl-ADP-ribose deacetylase [bacterium]HPP02775.1 O-acetyl-ADP-ribose deacetylase [bacterium]
MKRAVLSSQVELVQGDITRQDTDAIVNAANSSLLGGGGVDGAIHRAGGPAILEECRRLGGCAAGDAKITTGGNLKARYVIHAVGPVYRGGSSGEADLLARCYRRSLEIAVEHGLRTIAFPSISTGAYRYPVREAARVALRTVKEFLETQPAIQLVRFVLFDETAFHAYAEAMEEIWP